MVTIQHSYGRCWQKNGQPVKTSLSPVFLWSMVHELRFGIFCPLFKKKKWLKNIQENGS